jgi:hypothetical protein
MPPISCALISADAGAGQTYDAIATPALGMVMTKIIAMLRNSNEKERRIKLVTRQTQHGKSDGWLECSTFILKVLGDAVGALADSHNSLTLQPWNLCASG